ncbi:hypothetical protein HanRHA438_Chr13g0621141 [Helianthus annuus]|nr:hypothetical protein HanRHA438_Chr13g0621141 [Helianthus annuus]
MNDNRSPIQQQSVPNNSKSTNSTPYKPSINNSLSDASRTSDGKDVQLLQPIIDKCFKRRNKGSPIHFGKSNPRMNIY